MTQAMLQHQQLQQLKQLHHQQQLFLQQQQLRQTQHQMLKVAGMATATPTAATTIGTHPPNGYTNQRPVNPYMTAANYYGGWGGQSPYGWGVTPQAQPVVANNFSQNPVVSSGKGSMGAGTNGKLVNPVQWTGQTGLKPTQQHNVPGLEQGFQNINLKH